MAILTAVNVGQSFGAFDVFKGVSASVPNDGKVGLVGPNGIGKTTLLLILAGLEKAPAGFVHLAKSAKIGYLPQQATQAFTGKTNTVYQEMETLFSGIHEQASQLQAMEAAMAEGDFDETLFARYSKAQEAFERAGGYDYEVRIKQVLTGLGFPPDKWDLPLAHLSGGQKTRVLLAKLLLEKPDLLILDEPTNHLDVEAIEWLEGALLTWDGAILIVSHDRYFLDKVVNTVWEMSRDGIETYRGNYSAYVTQRQERWDRRSQEFDDFKERMERELDFIRKHMASQRTSQAKGKLKRITRELKAVQILGVRGTMGKSWSQITDEVDIPVENWGVADAAKAIKSLALPSGRLPEIHINLRPPTRSGRLVLRTYDLQVGYPGTHLFDAEDIELTRLECAALIGPNGTGKTTFLRTIMGELEALSGRVKHGASLQVGYFAQAHERLNPDNSVLDELLNFQNMPVSEARNYLAQYLFRGDDVYKKISALSGGERGRLALSLLALEGANFLLLDEPTNHLDIHAQEVLQAVLENFAGTILMVSHDRYLVNRLATQIWDLREGQLRVYNGSYQAYLDIRQQDAEQAKLEAQAERQAAKQATNGSKKLSKNEARKRRQAIEAVEKAVSEAETHIETLSNALQTASAEQDFDKIQALSIEYANAETHLEELLTKWEEMTHDETVA